jgi:hypothetical protein
MEGTNRSVINLGALEVYLQKSRIRFDPAFTIETYNILSIREDLIWLPVAYDRDGRIMETYPPQFSFKLPWKEVEVITVLATSKEMRWTLKATPIHDGHQVRVSAENYHRTSNLL